MATWILKTQHKKNAIEKQHWYKDGKEIIRTEGYRWGAFYCESDEQPEIDLVNPDGYEIGSDDYEWELTRGKPGVTKAVNEFAQTRNLKLVRSGERQYVIGV